MKFADSKNKEVHKKIDSCKRINIFARKIWKRRAGGRENKRIQANFIEIVRSGKIPVVKGKARVTRFARIFWNTWYKVSDYFEHLKWRSESFLSIARNFRRCSHRVSHNIRISRIITTFLIIMKKYDVIY